MIAEARAALLAVLETAGLPAYSIVPDRNQPPFAVLTPGAEWIDSGEAFGEFVVNFDVNIVVDMGTNQAMQLALDEAVEAVLTAVTEASGMYAAAVGQPSGVDLNGAMYLGTTITVKQNLNL